MRVDAEILFRPTADRRRDERIATSLTGGLETEGAVKVRARIVNVSSHGCRIEVTGKLLEGDIVSIKVGLWEPWQARVVWSTHSVAGLEFVHPLHPAFVQQMMGSPARRSQ